jgi:putative transposase
MENHFYRGKLPHWQPPEGSYFITYNLYGSIPKPVIRRLKDEYNMALRNLDLEEATDWKKCVDAKMGDAAKRTIKSIYAKKRYDAEKRHFKSFDDFLDSNLNEPHWLKNPTIATLNAEALHHYADKHYKLWGFCIMSNHIHLLLTLLTDAPILWKVLQNIKKYTGKEGNKLLDRKGERFWENESYDHLVRNKEGEFDRILFYILNNPVKAGLVKDWKAYKWTYCHPDFC